VRDAFIALTALLMASCGGGGSDLGLYDPDAYSSRAQLLRARQQTRAYDGAPPVIPHEVAARGRQNCNSCHTPGDTTTPDRVGHPRSHPAWGDCRQCHVEQVENSLFSGSNLEGLWWPASGSRLYSSAPPTIPHALQNRELCEVCHIGDQAPLALRAEHGPRQNCTQCHVANTP
jgi:cytochrome c-type protein NapB